ncbi:MAG: alpha/beta hydrolase [bacterium]|nr:alpha/beta hydrolase [bacterium]
MFRTAPLAVALGLLAALSTAQKRATTTAIESFRDERYSTAARAPARNRLDLYLPKDRATRPPLVMFVHGGSWIAGGKDRHRRLGERLARRGIATAVINYRLSPIAKFPAHVEDCATAFRWLRKRADEYRFDQTRMSLMGHSAGGHLCALLALDRELQERFEIPPTAIHGVVGLSGVYDVRPPHRLLDGVFGKRPAGRSKASPIVHAHAAAPPFFLRWGSRDLNGLPESARRLAARLRTFQVAVDAAELAGEGHTGYAYRVARESCAIGDPLLDFLRRPRPPRAAGRDD